MTKRPIKIGDFEYPAGVSLLASAYLVHHDPDIYPDPMAFRPERFLALEVIVEGALRNTGGGRDVLHAAAIKALLNQDLKPGVDDLLAYIWSSHANSI